MFPGLGGMNPKKMQAMMKQLGMDQTDIDASKVVIEKAGGGKIVIENPGVTKITMQGQESWQVTGEAREEVGEKFSEEDVKTVAEKTGKSEEESRGALEAVDGDLAEAILKLG